MLITANLVMPSDKATVARSKVLTLYQSQSGPSTTGSAGKTFSYRRTEILLSDLGKFRDDLSFYF